MDRDKQILNLLVQKESIKLKLWENIEERKITLATATIIQRAATRMQTSTAHFKK